jgi:hypothetical protein
VKGSMLQVKNAALACIVRLENPVSLAVVAPQEATGRGWACRCVHWPYSAKTPSLRSECQVVLVAVPKQSG